MAENVKNAADKSLDAVTAKMKRAFPKAKMVKIKLARHLGGDKKFVYVGVNGHTFQVPTGKEYEVSEPIYKQLKRMEAQMDVIEDIRDAIPKNAEG